MYYTIQKAMPLLKDREDGSCEYTSVPVIGMFDDGPRMVIMFLYDWDGTLQIKSACSEGWGLRMDKMLAWCHVPTYNPTKKEV